MNRDSAVVEHIDLSLARGLANSIARDSRFTSDDQRLALHHAHIKPRPRGRAALYRWSLDVYRATFAHSIAIDRALGSPVGRKADQHLFLLWDSLADSMRMALAAVLVRARNFDQLDHTLFIVSQHACERVFQRLGTSDMTTVRKELSAATKTVCSFWAVLPVLLKIVPDFTSNGLLVPTRSGAFVVIKPEDQAQLVATTWLAANQLRPEQTIMVEAIQAAVPHVTAPPALQTFRLPPDPYPFMQLVLHSARCTPNLAINSTKDLL